MVITSISIKNTNACECKKSDASECKKSDVVIGKICRDIPYIHLQVNITVKTSLQNGN